MKKRTFDKIQHALMIVTQERGVNFLNLITAHMETLEQTWSFMVREDTSPRDEKQDQEFILTS